MTTMVRTTCTQSGAFRGSLKVKEQILTRITLAPEGVIDDTEENLAQLEVKIGFPQPLSILANTIYRGLDKDEAEAWLYRLFETVNPGADLSRTHHRFVHWLLTEEAGRYVTTNDDPSALAAIDRVAELHQRAGYGQSVSPSEWDAAEKATFAVWKAAWKWNCNLGLWVLGDLYEIVYAAGEASDGLDLSITAGDAAWNIALIKPSTTSDTCRRMGEALIELMSAA